MRRSLSAVFETKGLTVAQLRPELAELEKQVTFSGGVGGDAGLGAAGMGRCLTSHLRPIPSASEPPKAYPSLPHSDAIYPMLSPATVRYGQADGP